MSVFVKFTLKMKGNIHLISYISLNLILSLVSTMTQANSGGYKSDICISEKRSFVYFNNSKLHNLLFFFIPGNSIISKTEMHAAKFLFKRC